MFGPDAACLFLSILKTYFVPWCPPLNLFSGKLGTSERDVVFQGKNVSRIFLHALLMVPKGIKMTFFFGTRGILKAVQKVLFISLLANSISIDGLGLVVLVMIPDSLSADGLSYDGLNENKFLAKKGDKIN